MKFDGLPDDALLKIFAQPILSTCERVTTLPLVCKRWSAILQEPSSAWKHIQLKFPTDYDLLVQWLCHRAPAIQSLRLLIADINTAEEQESSLLIGNLIQCAIDSTALRKLHIVGGNKLYMDCGRWLPDLRSLEHLYLEEIDPDHKHFFPSWFLNMNHLSKLQALEIKGGEYVLPYSGPSEYRALPLALESMTELQRLSLNQLGICAFTEEEFTEDLVISVGKLHHLRDLQLTGFEFTNVTPFTALSSLSSLDMSFGPYQPFDASAMTELRSFSYEFYGFADQMKHMAILLPHGLTHLKVSTLGIWSRHSKERHIIIQDFMENRIQYPASLSRLDLSGLGLTALPSPVISLKNLRSISLANNQLESLPSGEWQQNLDNADFSLNNLPVNAMRDLCHKVRSVDIW